MVLESNLYISKTTGALAGWRKSLNPQSMQSQMQSRMHLITLNASVPNKPFGIYLLVHSSNWFETLVIFDFGGTAVGGTWFRSGLTSQIGKNKGKSNAMACCEIQVDRRRLELQHLRPEPQKWILRHFLQRLALILVQLPSENVETSLSCNWMRNIETHQSDPCKFQPRTLLRWLSCRRTLLKADARSDGEWVQRGSVKNEILYRGWIWYLDIYKYIYIYWKQQFS